MANVRSTHNYTYSTEDCLGIGATCEVFKAISKKGEIRALKVFEPRADRDIEREITALRELKHPNIIKYFGCEEEIGSRRLVVVTEFCDGGSLLDYLNRPEFSYGLDEEEFLLFFDHILAGMKHYREKGFIHRDIKPANILRSIAEDGSSIYKLSDFGTAKSLSSDECFQSLVGTEEYLHPDIYKAAFLDRSNDRQFSHSVDLWSLGATLYHAASGKVPFRPHHGRADKLTMFDMIAKKPPGVIAGLQTAHRGEIKWSYELPSTCQLSTYLKKWMTCLILNLMENDPAKLWTFEDFFEEAEDILKKEVVVVLTPSSIINPFSKIYLHATQTIADLRKQLEMETNIAVQEQQVIIEDIKLSELVKSSDQIQSLPRTSREEPMILLPGRSWKTGTRESDPILAEVEATSSKFMDGYEQVNDDHKHAKRLLEQVALIQRQSHVMSLMQRHFIGTRRRLRRKQSDREDNMWSKYQYVLELFQNIRDLAESCYSSQGHSNMPPDVAKIITKITNQLDTCGQGLNRECRRTDDISLENYLWCFENSVCKKKFSRWLGRGKDVLSNFAERRKKRSRSRLDERVHMLEKKEMKQIHLHATEQWAQHCIQKNRFLQDSFKTWAKEFYETEDRLKAAEKTLDELQTLLAEVSRSVAQSEKSLVTSVSRTESIRQKSLQSIDKRVKDELQKTQEMKAIVIDFNKKYCEIFEGLEQPMELELPDDFK